MVYEDETSDHYSSLQYINSFDDGIYQIPATMEDPDFMGIETELMVLCENHGKASERRLAFEGFDIGRRFLACAEPEGQNCGFVEWRDPEWPPTMQNALLKLWAMYEESKSDRKKDNLESSLAIHHLTEEKNKLEANYAKLVQDVHALLNAQEEGVLDFSYVQAKTEMAKTKADHSKLQEKYEILKNLTKAQANAIQNLKFNHLKEKLNLGEDRRNLQFHIAELIKSEEKLTQDRVQLKLHIAELLKAEEKNKMKMKGIQSILNE